jgi:signal transduction histidine kinase
VSRPSLRLRLTALYGGLLLVAMALVLGASYWLVGRHLDRTLPPADAAAALHQLGLQYGLALLGAALLACGVGWLFAGRQLAPMARAFAAQERFVANASHELRSPLTVIRTEAEVTLADPRAGTGELREMGSVVIEASDRMEALLDGLMELARGRAGRQPAGGEPVDLASVVHPRRDGTAGRRVALHLDLAPARTRGDARLLERLAGNLIDNGLRYNHAGGRVDVSTVEAGGRALLRVSNSGPVLDPAGVARLLEPFERGSRTGEPGGAGLGLSIVRAIAEAHGGTVALRARDAGGLEVEVALPRA